MSSTKEGSIVHQNERTPAKASFFSSHAKTAGIMIREVYDHFERKIEAIRALGCSIYCYTLQAPAVGSGGEPIGSSARKHLVDAQHVVRVEADSQVEVILASSLDHVLHPRDTSSRAKHSYPISRDNKAGREPAAAPCCKKCGRPQAPRKKRSPSRATRGGRKAENRRMASSSCRCRRSSTSGRAHRDRTGTWGKPCS